jgi:LPXTG-site transpeptidase (sortase) family protein
MANFIYSFIANIGLKTLLISLMLILLGLIFITYIEIGKNTIGNISPQVSADKFDQLNLDDENTNSFYQDMDELTALMSQFDNPKNLNITSKSFSNPIGIEIPAIHLSSQIKELEIIDTGSSKEYETPDNVVGHIPNSSNPGEPGSIWLFGHLESPIRNEGSVFSQIPEIYELIENGNTVHIILTSSDGKFLYKVTEFTVIPKEQLILKDSENTSLILVTCWPKFVYDERIIVGSILVGVQLKEIN